jgi:hypothetical protein
MIDMQLSAYRLHIVSSTLSSIAFVGIHVDIDGDMCSYG